MAFKYERITNNSEERNAVQGQQGKQQEAEFEE